MTSLRLIVVALVLSLCSCSSLISGCVINVGGSNVALTNWDGNAEFTVPDSTNTQIQYFVSFCNPISLLPICTSASSYMCQITTGRSPTLQYTIAFTNTAPLPTWTPLNGDMTKGITLNTANGDATGCPSARTATINLQCDPTAVAMPTTADDARVISTNNCAYSVTVRTSSVCGYLNPPSSDSGLSGGSVFLIIFFVGGFVYVFFGCLYKRQKMGTSGMRESCPNVDFWSAIPGLVKDGCSFTYRKIRGLCDGGANTSGTYNNL